MIDSDDTEESAPDQPSVDPDDGRIRFSRLKLMAQSPMHYLANPRGDTPELDKGTAVHAVMFGQQRVTYYPEKTKAGKCAPRNGAKWEAFKAYNSDAKILTLPQYEQVNRMVDALQAHREAMEALTGVQEQRLEFDFLGLPSRSTPDVRGNGFYTELKTTVSADPRRFKWQSLKLMYHAQMAFHQIAIKRAGHGDAGEPFVVAVEKGAVHAVTVFKMTARALEQGEKTLRLWFEQLKGCLDSGQWPAYSQSVVDLDVPDDDEVLFADGIGVEESPNIPF